MRCESLRQSLELELECCEKFLDGFYGFPKSFMGFSWRLISLVHLRLIPK